MKKILASLFAVICTVMLAVIPALALDEQVTASVEVEGVCTLEATPTSLDFGTLLPETTSASPETVTLTNTGNTGITSLEVSGTNWGAGFPVGQTDYDDDSGYTDLTSGGTDVFGGSLADDGSDNVDFKVTIPPDQPADNYQQTITFTFGCNQG